MSSAELEKKAKRKELQEKIMSERQKEMEKALEEEKDVQKMILAVEKERWVCAVRPRRTLQWLIFEA